MTARATSGRREQHKANTRRALLQAARQLFEAKGFQATTVRDIAEAAGVVERTFFRYFPSKDHLVTSELRELIPELQHTLRSRPAGEPPYTALREADLEMRQKHGSLPEILFRGPGTTADQPELTDRDLVFEFEQAVTKVFSERLHDTITDETTRTVHAAALARAGIGALRTVLLVYAQLPEHERTPERVTQLTDEAFAALEGHPARPDRA